MSESTGSVLIVCTGNVCRSPYVEHRLRHLIPAQRSLNVASAGTAALVGEPMAPWAVRQLSRRGVDRPAAFAARQLTAAGLRASDLVLAATAEHRAQIVQLEPAAADRTYTIGQVARLLVVAQAPTTLSLPEFTRWLARHRHLTGPRRPTDDIPDPWLRSRFAYAAMARKADPMIEVLAAALSAAEPVSRRS